MALLKKAATVAVLASAGVMGTAGIAAADEGWVPPAPQIGDNQLHQAGFFPVNLLDNVNLSPNLGCLADRVKLPSTVAAAATPPVTDLSHALEHANLNLLANGNVTTQVHDDSCTSNEGSSQAGNNSHGSTGAGSSASEHNAGNGAGSHDAEDGKGAGGLLGGVGFFGTGL